MQRRHKDVWWKRLSHWVFSHLAWRLVELIGEHVVGFMVAGLFVLGATWFAVWKQHPWAVTVLSAGSVLWIVVLIISILGRMWQGGLTVRVARRLELGSGGSCYSYEATIRNESRSRVAENVQASLANAPSLSMQAKMHAYFANKFPIPLKAKHGDGKTINPQEIAAFLLFRIARAANGLEIEILDGNSSSHSLQLTPQEGTFAVQVSAKTQSLRVSQFRLKPEFDSQGTLSSFDVEPV